MYEIAYCENICQLNSPNLIRSRVIYCFSLIFFDEINYISGPLFFFINWSIQQNQIPQIICKTFFLIGNFISNWVNFFVLKNKTYLLKEMNKKLIIEKCREY